MALANFFNRAATAAAQVLQGFDIEAFQSVLSSRTVGLAFDGSAVKSAEGAVTVELTLNLLARLYPTLAIVGLDRAAKGAMPALEAAARAINPEIVIRKTLKSVDPCVVVGQTAVSGPGRPVYAGSDGWVARLSTSGPVGSTNSNNPFGASAAACFAAANVFRVLFGEQLSHGPPDESLALSLFDYSQGPTAAGPELPTVDIGRTHLVGVGAIGNGFVWALARVTELRGSLWLVDHEFVDLSNLQRYSLATQGHLDVSKVELAANFLKRPGLEVHQVLKTWGAFLTEADDFNLERVAVALDSAKDRISVQASLPRWLCNAWTQPGDLGVSRHAFDDDGACLACLYLPDQRLKDEDEIVATALGLPDARREIRSLLYNNGAVTGDLLTRIADALSLPRDSLAAFENKPIRTFYIEAFCGGIVFRLTGGARPAEALVPMAFQSALAGIMLASEIVIHACGLRDVAMPTTTTINLLRPLAPYVSFPRAKDSRHRCLCQDPDYIAAYRTKWIGAIANAQ